ncbi:MAG: exo-alpha-sialidase [Akkermansia sp.]|nr:exo-alpha-sialidase [Akkermansia sp.]
MFRKIIYSLLACGLAFGTESFEKFPNGKLSTGAVEFGQLVAEAGHAEIHGKGRSGGKCLRVMGGTDRTVSMDFTEALPKETKFQFWVERWTNKAPFKLEVKAVTPQGESTVTTLNKAGTGGFHTKVEGKLPGGATAMKLVAETPEGSGVLVDDLSIMLGEMKVSGVEIRNPGVYPMMKRALFNPVLLVDVKTTGADKPKLVDKLVLKVTDPDQVAKVTLRSGDANGMSFRGSVEYGSATPGKDGKVLIKSRKELQGGDNYLWIDVEPAESAVIGSTATFKDVSITIDGQLYEPEMEPVTQRIGTMLAFPGEKVGNQPDGAAPRDCIAFRIPGLIRTQKGTLIGCFDARYTHEGDLCADIDVATVRSTDGGQTWTMPEVSLDAGPGGGNGCGDPCILQDKKGRIWMQALATHFARGRAINASGTGTAPDRTGQWEMVYSDNDGKTWSKVLNVTDKVKKDEWTLILAGPGNGICTTKGVIVFPAQIWQNGADPVCRSTICYSTDGGKKWKMGNGVPAKTSECQVVELQDGSLMLNCRNEAYGGRRVIYVTKDLGETWEPHATNCNALSEPTCQASLVTVETKKYGRLMLFSNPKKNGRSNMTVRASQDDGQTWNEGLLYDVRRCMGYSCLALTDPDHVGVIYETCHTTAERGERGIGFIRLPLETIVTGEEVEVKPASASGEKAGKKGKKGKKARKGKSDKKDKSAGKNKKKKKKKSGK